MNTFMTRKIEQDLVKLNIPHFLDNVKALMRNVGKFNKILNKPKTQDQDRIKIIEVLSPFLPFCLRDNSRKRVEFAGPSSIPSLMISRP